MAAACRAPSCCTYSDDPREGVITPPAGNAVKRNDPKKKKKRKAEAKRGSARIDVVAGGRVGC